MTEYKETAKDREDIWERTRLFGARGHFERMQVEAGQVIMSRRIVDAIEETLLDIQRRIDRLDHDILARQEDFQTDRKRLQRAFKALRKAGFKAILGETPYESTSPSKVFPEGVDPDDFPGRYVYAYSNHLKYAFEDSASRRYRYGRTPSDTLSSSIYLHWGPNADENVAAEVIEAIEAEGLRTKWDGTGSDCVEVLSATDSKEEAA